MKSVVLLFLLSSWCAVAENGYLGRDVCAGCHKGIAARQTQTRMAHTWQGSSGTQLPANYEQTHKEGPDPAIEYLIRRTAKSFNFQVRMPGRDAAKYPVEDTTGGTRHGVSFLARIRDVEGLPLARAPLVETRYLYSTHANDLALAPGFRQRSPQATRRRSAWYYRPASKENACHVTASRAA